LDKKEKKEFDAMWDIPRLYVSACSNSVQLVPLHPIVISILFHHYKELLQCVREVEEMNMKCSMINNKEEQETEETQEIPAATLDGFLKRNS
jgi:hypothetical protein